MRTPSVTVTELELPGVLLITPEKYEDDRGYFIETYNAAFFETLGVPATFVQDGVSRSKKGVLRGLHFQKAPHAQAKLVRCTEGEILDVAADVDPASPTFGKYITANLSGDTQAMLYIPKGYAHGFCVLSEQATVEYKLEEVHPEFATGVRYNDPSLAIVWPIEEPILSEKDKNWPLITE